MDNIPPVEALLFPADGRTPHLVELMSSIITNVDPMTGQVFQQRIAHPQVHMNYIASNTTHCVWESRIIRNILYARNFQYPYVVFFPILSQSGAPFPVNLNIKEIQGRSFKETVAWRGDIVVAKYSDQPYGTLMDCAMSDYPMIKNWLTHHTPYNRYVVNCFSFLFVPFEIN